MPKSLSVIVPAYNCEKTLLDTLTSIETSLGFFQRTPLAAGCTAGIVVVDDCSSDLTASVASDFARRSPACKVISAPENRGAGFARNFGVKATSAELIFFCDGDDLYFENHVLTCVQMMADSPGCDAVKTGVHTADRLHPHFEKVVQTSIPSNLCVKRKCHDFVEGYPEDLIYKRRGGEDTAYILMLGRFFKIHFTDVKTVHYRRVPGNSFDQQLKKFQNPPGALPQFASDEERKSSDAVWNLFEEKLNRLLKKEGGQRGAK